MALRDALAGVPKMPWQQTGHIVAIPETEDDNAEGRINFGAIFNKLVGKKFARFVAAANPARIARLIAHMDAQAVRLDAAVLAEREACAVACDGLYYKHIGAPFGEVRHGIAACAAAIRQRAAIASEAKP